MCPFMFGEEPRMFKAGFHKENHPKCVKKNPHPWSPNYKLIDLIALHCRYEDCDHMLNNLIQAKKERQDLYYYQYGTQLQFCVGEKYNLYDL